VIIDLKSRRTEIAPKPSLELTRLNYSTKLGATSAFVKRRDQAGNVRPRNSEKALDSTGLFAIVPVGSRHFASGHGIERVLACPAEAASGDDKMMLLR
jgi:hypothetical protein